MGVFNELKKAFFGASSIAKHGAEKAKESGKEASDRLAADLEDMGEKIAQRTDEQMQKAQMKSEEIGGKILETTEHVGEEVLKRTSEFWEKTKKTAEDLSEDILEKTKKENPSTSSTNKNDMQTNTPDDLANDLINEAFEESSFDTTTSTEQSSTTSNPMHRQAAEQVEEQDSIFENLMNKAEDLSDKLKDKVGDFDAPRETKIGYDNAKGSLLEGQDDFFARAQRFADGDYHNTGTEQPKQKVGDFEIRRDPDYQKPKNEGTVKGFEDMDGDGDEIIDDAIILDD